MPLLPVSEINLFCLEDTAPFIFDCSHNISGRALPRASEKDHLLLTWSFQLRSAQDVSQSYFQRYLPTFEGIVCFCGDSKLASQRRARKVKNATVTFPVSMDLLTFPSMLSLVHFFFHFVSLRVRGK